MFDIDINPVLFSIGTFEVRWYGIMIVLAVLAAVTLSLVEAKRKNFSQDAIWDIALWAVIGGIIGARLFHILDHLDLYYAHPEQLLNFAGLAVWGAVIGAAVALIIYCTVKRISFWLLGDIVAPGAIMAQAIGRVGCIINGCCYGDTCTLPISVVYQNPNSYAVQGVPLYPTQEFHLIWNLIGFAILWLLRKRLKPDGVLFLVWLIIFAAGDYVIRFFRADLPTFLFGLPESQVIDIAVLFVSVILLVFRVTRYKPSLPAEESAAVSKNAQNQED